ncbi:hypothetical protein, partial [Streptomyces sp. NPDC002346]
RSLVPHQQQSRVVGEHPPLAAVRDDAVGEYLFIVLMGEDVEARRSFIQRNAKDVRFLDI